MTVIRTVFAILDADTGTKIKAVCSSKRLADATAPAYGDWYGHGSATVVERLAVEIDGKLYLLANDHDPEIELDKAPAAVEAAKRLSATDKLTTEELAALGFTK